MDSKDAGIVSDVPEKSIEQDGLELRPNVALLGRLVEGGRDPTFRTTLALPSLPQLDELAGLDDVSQSV